MLRLRRWWVIGIAALTVVTAVGLTLRQDPTYVSQAQVLVRPAPFGPGGDEDEPNMATERSLAGSALVTQLAAERFAAEDVLPPVGGLVVEIVEQTEILAFTFVSNSPADAQRGAQAFAEAYLDFREQQATEESESATQALAQEIELQQRQLRAVNRLLAQTNDEFERRSLEAQQIELATEIGAMSNQLNEIRAADRGRVGQVVVPAGLPGGPTGPNPLRNGILALIAGLALGIGAAFLVDRLDDRVRDPDALEHVTGAPMLSLVPQIPRDVLANGPVVLGPGDNQYAEAFRTLRTGLLFAAAEREFRTVLVTSPGPGEGKTHTVANLAVAIAQAGKRVVAVSADLRRPALHLAFGLPRDLPGISELITERRNVWDLLVRPQGVENLWILPSGSPSHRPPDLLSSRMMTETLDTLRGSADVVLVDVGPVLAVPDALALAPQLDAVLLVVAAERTTRSSVRHAIRQLQLVNARVLGTVLNAFRPRGVDGPYAYYGEYRPSPAPQPGDVS